MIRRLFWGLVGIGLGAVIGAAVVRWANQTKARMSPQNVARSASGVLADWRDRAAEAIVAGAEEMARREAELRDELGLR